MILGMAKVFPSVAAGGLRGTTGNAVFVQSRFGTILRSRPFVSNTPPTPAQAANRRRLAKIGAAWRGMSLEQALAWRIYAEAESVADGSAMALPQLAFTRLAMRYLQVNPDGPIPLAPPTTAFPGDSVRVQLAASPGLLRVTGLSANAPGVVTELLIQKLASVHRRTYERKFVAADYLHFSAGQSVNIPALPGIWAVATRFTLAATGQTTPLLEVGRILVPA